jgi:hypothetical protein
MSDSQKPLGFTFEQLANWLERNCYGFYGGRSIFDNKGNKHLATPRAGIEE